MMRHLFLLSILILSVVIEINGCGWGGPNGCRKVCRGRRTSHCACTGCCVAYGLNWGGYCCGGICHCNGFIKGIQTSDSRPGMMVDDADMYDGDRYR